MNKLPFNLSLDDQPQRPWPMHDELMTVVQYYPRNPIWAVRPYYPDALIKHDIKHPDDLHPYIDDEAKLLNISKWLSLNMRSEYRSRRAGVVTIGNYDTKAYRPSALPITNINHITSLYEKLKYPTSIGVFYPEGLPLVMKQVKKIWLPNRVSNENELFPDWHFTRFATHVEYRRIK